MAMGRQTDRQGDLMVTWSELPRSPGHAFYDRLQQVLVEAGFDAFVETTCQPFYAATMGARSVPPGRYFRMHMVGYFEGIDASTMEANAALRAIMRRDTGEGDRAMLRRMAQESGIETPTADDLIRVDRQRKGKTLSNADWVSPTD